ncbi:MAG: hypothetical protein LBQ18_06685 [Campylobacteraceae bacterium]|nr:hypothetical protein [Campylobacteraceae bacterium]
MITPKGFGKNYFTLAAIQAYSNAAKLHSCFVKVGLFFTKTNKDQEDGCENDPPSDECDNQILLLLFSSRVQSALRSVKYKLAKIHRRLFYNFCRSGIHPPVFSKPHIHIHKIFNKKDRYAKK